MRRVCRRERSRGRPAPWMSGRAHDATSSKGTSVNTPVPSITDTEEVTTFSLREALAHLDSQLAGSLSVPGDPGWDAARTAWNLAVDQRPVAVVVAGSVGDIAQTVRAAKRLGLSVAPQGTGHNAGPLAAQHGLAALAGSSHDVGVVGYTLGGGISWLGRSHGLASNQVLAIELVTADGVRRRIDAEHDAELFWAVRGGGGDFGVVTALEFRLFPVAEIVAGTLFFPLQRAEEGLQAWAAGTAHV